MWCRLCSFLKVNGENDINNMWHNRTAPSCWGNWEKQKPYLHFFRPKHKQEQGWSGWEYLFATPETNQWKDWKMFFVLLKKVQCRKQRIKKQISWWTWLIKYKEQKKRNSFEKVNSANQHESIIEMRYAVFYLSCEWNSFQRQNRRLLIWAAAYDIFCDNCY